VARRTIDLGVFEIGRVFLESGDVLPEQPYHVAVLLHGHAEPPGVFGPGRRYDVHDLTGILAALGGALGVEMMFEQARLPGYRPGRAARVVVAGRPAGDAGELDPSVLASLGLDAGACAAELDFDVLIAAVEPPRAKAVSVFPPAYLDLAWWVQPGTAAGDVCATIRAAAGALLEDVTVFDDYRPGDGRRSLAYRLTFRSLTGTLRDTDLAAPTRAVQDAVAREHKAELRSL
jgi:phenylalanyl-tRNA synthetase beta chain